MIVRPNPGRLRALLRTAGQIRNRPRPSTSITPTLSPIRGHSGLHTATSISHLSSRNTIRAVSRRHFGTHTSASVRSATTLSAVLKRFLVRTARAVRFTLAKHHIRPSLRLFFRTTKLAPSSIRSPLLKGAIETFKSTASRTATTTTRAVYARLNNPTVAFSRGALSGIGPRPAAGQLTLSPLRGGMGLQSARKFSSGGARVFDNLIVNAPLALRLAGDEVEEKAKLASRKPMTSRRLVHVTGARRTGATFTSAKLPLNAFAFATSVKRPQQQSTASIAEESIKSDLNTNDLSEYFQFPQLPLTSPTACDTVISIRLVDPLFVALGGRDPTPPSHASCPRLFDEAFLFDANTALEYEHRRYLRAKALLRVLWDSGLVKGEHEGEMDLFSDPAMWTVRIIGREPGEVRRTLRASLAFEWEPWCTISPLSNPEENNSQLGDPSHVDPSSPSQVSTRSILPIEEAWEDMSSPLSTNDGEWMLEAEGERDSLVESEDLMSLPSDMGLSSDDGDLASSLYDSRDWL
ncbi:uncharacterized protein UTRI_05214_B [Ustilago trichophora]|uniref:Uncharacterized protein n=1 Tax=Ustilago trichophora TaxID=86804 RepID=A0A5C3EPI8_9BASI|nr:uncharacterized protein UTRI_05214_B [Ustilago trichophora]